MTELLKHRLDLLSRPEHLPLLGQGLRGVEREALRTDREGRLARSPHPLALGSALTHSRITTDYSESLLELITSPHPDAAPVMRELDLVHRFVQQVLGDDEMMWMHSMPAELPPEPEIPIAWYGKSHIGMLKHVYRRGLALRYGRAMQCIAGIHYNFSLAEGLWEVLRQDQGSAASSRDFQSEGYIALIRNFQRRSWLLMVLFGASPALPLGFLQGRAHRLQSLAPDTLYLPHATSLRMSDLGYQNKAQAGLIPPYNTLPEYMRGMAHAVRLPYPEYEAIGLKRDGEWVQISTNVLQIENEYYATIRPKRVTRPGERPLQALCERGVQYVEVRCMDVDPFEPVGISLDTARFLDVFLLYCALDNSPPIDGRQAQENLFNFSSAVREGRRPGLQLRRGSQPVEMTEWGLELLEEMTPVAALLDQHSADDAHMRAIREQRQRLLQVELTPSARALEGILQAGSSFHRFAMAQSRSHAASFLARGVSAQEQQAMQQEVDRSLQEQARMEAQDTGSFDEFIEAYRAATPSALCQD